MITAHIFIAAAAELVGMFLLILLGNGTCAAFSLTNLKKGNWLSIIVGWFLALFIAIVVANGINSYASNWNNISENNMAGASLNVAGLIISYFRNVAHNVDIANSTICLFVFIIFQIIGAFLGQLIVYVLFYKHYQITNDSNAILGTHCTSGSLENTNLLNLASEIVGTFVLFLALGWINSSIGPVNNATSATIIAAVVGGVGMSIGTLTGFALNPVRDLIPRLFHFLMPYQNKGSSNWKYSYVPVAGPICGALIASFCTPGLFF